VSAPDFAAQLELHRGEIQVHCYRMLGSLEDSEDLVQETFLRAWRHRATFTFDGPSSLRAWLYRIATNACLDFLRGRPRRILPMAVADAADPNAMPPPPVDLPWLQPYPDRLLESVAPPEDEPATAVVARETIELAFIAAIQHLPPRQRAVLLLRDVLGWSAKDTAALIEASVASVNSALQRARATLKDRLPKERTEWTPVTPLTEGQRDLLRRYLDAHQQQDGAALAALLREDARLTMPPHPAWYDGRDAIVLASEKGFDPDFGTLLSVAVGANAQPAVAHYLKAPGERDFRPLAFDLLRVDAGQISEINTFVFPDLFEAFGLPARR
jgi:RNA polymerase sigma-70 factor, ECF subfamily